MNRKQNCTDSEYLNRSTNERSEQARKMTITKVRSCDSKLEFSFRYILGFFSLCPIYPISDRLCFVSLADGDIFKLGGRMLGYMRKYHGTETATLCLLQAI